MGVNTRVLGVALAVVAVTALATAGATALSERAAGPVPATPAEDVDGATVAADAAAVDAAAADSESPRARLRCTNGTSEALVACGYNPGPTAVELADQRTFGQALTVPAVELNDSGFVAVHRVSYVDGAFTSSIVGVSDHLSAGLHRDVAVPVEDAFETGGPRQLIAVTYRDGDDDGRFEFASSDGAVDRPFTNTYSPETGNVTDEAGDVIGDVGTVSVVSFVKSDSTGPPTSVDSDPLLEDINGDGEATFADGLVFNRVRTSAAVRENPRLFDFDGDGVAGTESDAEALFEELQ